MGRAFSVESVLPYLIDAVHTGYQMQGSALHAAAWQLAVTTAGDAVRWAAHNTQPPRQ
jgi:hypothetical protein